MLLYRDCCLCFLSTMTQYRIMEQKNTTKYSICHIRVINPFYAVPFPVTGINLAKSYQKYSIKSMIWCERITLFYERQKRYLRAISPDTGGDKQKNGAFGKYPNAPSLLVPGTRIELVQPYSRGILSPLRLPVPPPRQSEKQNFIKSVYTIMPTEYHVVFFISLKRWFWTWNNYKLPRFLIGFWL